MSGPRPFSRVELQDLLSGRAQALPDDAREAMFTRTFTAEPDPALDDLVPPVDLFDDTDDAGDDGIASVADTADPYGDDNPDGDPDDDPDDDAHDDTDTDDTDDAHTGLPDHGHDPGDDPGDGGVPVWDW